MADQLAKGGRKCPGADHAGKMRLPAAAANRFIHIIRAAAASYLLGSDIDILLALGKMRDLKQYVSDQRADDERPM